MLRPDAKLAAVCHQKKHQLIVVEREAANSTTVIEHGLKINDFLIV